MYLHFQGKLPREMSNQNILLIFWLKVQRQEP